MAINQQRGRRLSACARVVLVSALTANIPFQKLPPLVQQHVAGRLSMMAAENAAQTLLDHAIISSNPVPDRVTNHLKYRNTNPVMKRLLIPKFPLECDLVWAACPGRDFTRIDVSDIVRLLRAYAGVNSLIDYVGVNGIASLTGVMQRVLTRIS